MNFVECLLTEAKAAQGVGSDYALAKVSGIKQQTLSKYRTGRSVPCDEIMIQLAQLAGLESTKTLMSYHMRYNKSRVLRQFWTEMFSMRFPNESPVFPELEADLELAESA